MSRCSGPFVGCLLLFVFASFTLAGPGKEKKNEPRRNAVCVPADEETVVKSAWVEKGQLSYCLLSWDNVETRGCWTVDPNSGEVDTLSSSSTQPPPPSFETKNGGVEVCVLGDCVLVALSTEARSVDFTWFAINEKRTRLALVGSNGGETHQRNDFFEVYDVEKNVRMHYQKPLDDGFNYLCGSPQWLGDVLCLHTDVCAGPAGRSLLIDAESFERIGCVGCDEEEEPFISTYGDGAIHLSGDDWIFLDAFGSPLYVVNVRSGEARLKIELTEYGTDDGYNENANEVAVLPDRRIAVVLGGVNAGDVVLFDGSNGKLITHHKMPRCAEPPEKDENR